MSFKFKRRLEIVLARVLLALFLTKQIRTICAILVEGIMRNISV